MSLELPTGIRAVFTDLDGTLTHEGLVQPSTLKALGDLRERGYWVVLVTGVRLGGLIAFYASGLWMRRFLRTVRVILIDGKTKWISSHLRAVTMERWKEPGVKEIFEKAKCQVPNARLATDQPFRLFDFAIDHSEQEHTSLRQKLRRYFKYCARSPE